MVIYKSKKNLPIFLRQVSRLSTKSLSLLSECRQRESKLKNLLSWSRSHHQTLPSLVSRKAYLFTLLLLSPSLSSLLLSTTPTPPAPYAANHPRTLNLIAPMQSSTLYAQSSERLKAWSRPSPGNGRRVSELTGTIRRRFRSTSSPEKI